MKASILLIVLIVFTNLVSCHTPLSQTEKLLGHSAHFGYVGTEPAYYLVFDEPHFVDRIVIYVNHPAQLRNVEVYASIGRDMWQLVRQLKKPIKGTTEVSIKRRTKMIRVNSGTTGMHLYKRSSYSYYPIRGWNINSDSIQSIKAFGY